MNLGHIASVVSSLFGNGAKSVPTNGLPDQEKKAIDSAVNSARNAQTVKGNK